MRPRTTVEKKRRGQRCNWKPEIPWCYHDDVLPSRRRGDEGALWSWWDDGHGGAEGALSQGGADGSEDRGRVRAWWLEMETGDPQNEAKLGTGRPMADSSHYMGPTVEEPRD